MKCPFCNEDDFDTIGLKGHLVNFDCEPYNNLPSDGRLFSPFAPEPMESK